MEITGQAHEEMRHEIDARNLHSYDHAFAVLAIPIQLVAQEQQDNNHKQHHYKLIDMGTFGGPAGN